MTSDSGVLKVGSASCCAMSLKPINRGPVTRAVRRVTVQVGNTGKRDIRRRPGRIPQAGLQIRRFHSGSESAEMNIRS